MNHIQGLELENFTCFKHAKFNFCNGINFLLGKNGVGKTHILKLLYAYSKADINNENVTFDFQEKVEDTFFIENITSFCRENKDFKANIFYNDYSIISKSMAATNFGYRALSLKIQLRRDAAIDIRNPIYLPPVDILSQYKTYQNFEEISKLRLDATYKYLTESLVIPKVAKPNLYHISNSILKYTDGDIHRDDLGFYQEGVAGKIYSPLLADGLKKVLTIKYLIDNNEINSKSILFIDEPEVHLNPALLNKYSETLFELAKTGIQIFLSSHDYLLMYLLSLKSEYNKSEEPCIRFFNLYRDNEEPTKIEEGSIISDLGNVSIIHEYENLFDIEQSYFFNNLKSDDNS